LDRFHISKGYWCYSWL